MEYGKKVRLNKGPCIEQPTKYVWVTGKGCFEKAVRPSEVPPPPAPVAPVAAPPSEDRRHILTGQCKDHLKNVLTSHAIEHKAKYPALSALSNTAIRAMKKDELCDILLTRPVPPIIAAAAAAVVPPSPSPAPAPPAPLAAAAPEWEYFGNKKMGCKPIPPLRWTPGKAGKKGVCEKPRGYVAPLEEPVAAPVEAPVEAPIEVSRTEKRGANSWYTPDPKYEKKMRVLGRIASHEFIFDERYSIGGSQNIYLISPKEPFDARKFNAYLYLCQTSFNGLNAFLLNFNYNEDEMLKFILYSDGGLANMIELYKRKGYRSEQSNQTYIDKYLNIELPGNSYLQYSSGNIAAPFFPIYIPSVFGAYPFIYDDTNSLSEKVLENHVSVYGRLLTVKGERPNKVLQDISSDSERKTLFLKTTAYAGWGCYLYCVDEQRRIYDYRQKTYIPSFWTYRVSNHTFNFDLLISEEDFSKYSFDTLFSIAFFQLKSYRQPQQLTSHVISSFMKLKNKNLLLLNVYKYSGRSPEIEDYINQRRRQDVWVGPRFPMPEEKVEAPKIFINKADFEDFKKKINETKDFDKFVKIMHKIGLSTSVLKEELDLPEDASFIKIKNAAFPFLKTRVQRFISVANEAFKTKTQIDGEYTNDKIGFISRDWKQSLKATPNAFDLSKKYVVGEYELDLESRDYDYKWNEDSSQYKLKPVVELKNVPNLKDINPQSIYNSTTMETIYDYLARDMANEIIGNYYKMSKNQVEMAVKNKKAFPDLSVQDAKRLLAELEANPLVLPDIENPGDTVETDLPTDYIVVDGPHPGYHVTYRPNIDPPVTMPSALYFVKENEGKYKAVFLDSLLQNWEKQMSLFDPQSQHVVPQYPIWIETREEVLPSHIQEFLVVARDRGVFNSEELSVLYRAVLPHIEMFPDLYNWTKNYKASEMHYEKLARTKGGDRGMYNRRDVQAATQLDKISKRHKLISEDQFQGVRKYNFIGSDRNALEISLFCLLKEIILKTHTLQMKDNKDFEWVFTNKPYSFNSKVCEQNDQIGKNPCNKCYQSKVIPSYSREVVNFN